MVVIGDRVRGDAATVAWFADEGVQVKVVSGHPRTVGAIAGQVGIAGADHPVDARTLPEDPAELAGLVEGPLGVRAGRAHQKRAMVEALGDRGHVVAAADRRRGQRRPCPQGRRPGHRHGQRRRSLAGGGRAGPDGRPLRHPAGGDGRGEPPR